MIVIAGLTVIEIFILKSSFPEVSVVLWNFIRLDIFIFAGTVPAKVLLQLTTAFREGGLCNRTATFYYKNHLQNCSVPVLALAGDQDLICPPEAVYGKDDFSWRLLAHFLLPPLLSKHGISGPFVFRNCKAPSSANGHLQGLWKT